MMRSAGIALLLLVGLVGCAHRGSYRFEGGRIYTPTTHQGREELKVDLPLGRPFEGRCAFKRFRSNAATGKLRYGFPGAAPMLRLVLQPHQRDTLAARGDLEGGVRDEVATILKRAREEGCLTLLGRGQQRSDTDLDALAAFLAEQARERWPMTSREAVATWFGPGPVQFVVGEDGQPPSPIGKARMALVSFLQPGMRVCAQDVAEPSQAPAENIYLIDRTTCAVVIASPKGIAFSGTTPWLKDPFTGSTWAPGGFKQVTSWEEVQTGKVSDRFAVLHPTRLPDKPPHSAVGNGAFLIRYDPSRLIPMQAAYCVRDGLASNACPAPAALQSVGDSYRVKVLCASTTDNICVRFGNRSVFTVEIPVDVNGSRRFMPAGSTLSALAAPSAGAGPGEGRVPVDRVKVHRWFDGKRYRVRFGEDAGALPLQSGDEIQW